jgi:hypothetical protein
MATNGGARPAAEYTGMAAELDRMKDDPRVRDCMWVWRQLPPFHGAAAGAVRTRGGVRSRAREAAAARAGLVEDIGRGRKA